MLTLNGSRNLSSDIGIRLDRTTYVSMAQIDRALSEYLKTPNVIARSTATKQSQSCGQEIASLRSQ